MVLQAAFRKPIEIGSTTAWRVMRNSTMQRTHFFGQDNMNTIPKTITIFKKAKYKAFTLIALSLLINACTLINPNTVTKAKYDQIQTGMTLEQVQKVVGKPGEVTGEMSFNVPGVPDVPIGGQQALYHWKNPDGSSMTALFINDKLVLKTELNLK